MLFLPQLTPAKKRQLSYMLLLSLVVVIVVWVWWVTKFGYERSVGDKQFFSNLQQTSQTTAQEYNNFKSKLQSTWQQIEGIVSQSQKQAEIIDQMKERIPDLVVSSTTETTTTETATTSDVVSTTTLPTVENLNSIPTE